MVDVLLIYPPITFKKGVAETLDVTRPPLGLLYLASALEKSDISVRIMDVGAERLGIEDVLLIIEKECPSVVGISSMTANLQGAVQAAKEIKNRFGNKITIGLGGAHESADPEFVNRFFHLFDFGLVGEGEITFPKIVRRILNKEPFERINYGEIALNLDEIPFPARHLVKNNRYQKTVGIMAFRGCPYACIFCSRPAVSKKIRFSSPENILDEMEICFNDCRGEFIFEDDTFTLRKEHIFKLCEEMLRRKLDVRWSAITRADLVDESLLRKIREAGCNELTFGIESGNSRVRNQIIKKGLTDGQIFEAIDLCNRIGIKVNAFLMLGFPTETRKELYHTVNFASKLKINIVGIHLTLPMPGAPLFNMAQKEGLISKDIADRFATEELGEGFRRVWPVYVPSGLSIDELYRARRIGYYKFYFRPKYIMCRLLSDLKSWKQLKVDTRAAISLLLHGRSEASP